MPRMRFNHMELTFAEGTLDDKMRAEGMERIRARITGEVSMAPPHAAGLGRRPPLVHCVPRGLVGPPLLGGAGVQAGRSAGGASPTRIEATEPAEGSRSWASCGANG